MKVPLSVSLPLIVGIDLLAVALVVPLLQIYYKEAGVTTAHEREVLATLFSASQIVGGLLLGALSDAKILSRRSTLFLSFAGSTISYAMIMMGSLQMLALSRVIVGLVKQTMTVTTSLLARQTTPEERTAQMGRLSAAGSAAWIIGSSVGAVLYKNVHMYAPSIGACILFAINAVVAYAVLPASDETDEPRKEDQEVKTKQAASSSWTKKFSSLVQNLRMCFTSSTLGCFVLSKLFYHLMVRATSYNSMASYYEEMYGIEPHQRGYLQSYQGIMRIVVSSILLKPILRWFNGERSTVVAGSILMTLATFAEMSASFPLFLLVLNPILSASSSAMEVSLSSLLTQATPQESMSSVLGAMDVLQSVVGVTVPLYRTFLFSLLQRTFESNTDAMMRGDPDPKVWLMTTGCHWIFASILLAILLRAGHSNCTKKDP